MVYNRGRVFFILFLLAFAVFFGLDLVNRGMERVQGQSGASASGSVIPAANRITSTVSGAERPAGSSKSAAAVSAKPAKKVQAKAAKPNIIVKESFVNHLSNRIGDALRRSARALMGLIVSIFDSATG